MRTPFHQYLANRTKPDPEAHPPSHAAEAVPSSWAYLPPSLPSVLRTPRHSSDSLHRRCLHRRPGKEDIARPPPGIPARPDNLSVPRLVFRFRPPPVPRLARPRPPGSSAEIRPSRPPARPPRQQMYISSGTPGRGRTRTPKTELRSDDLLSGGASRRSGSHLVLHTDATASGPREAPDSPTNVRQPPVTGVTVSDDGRPSRRGDGAPGGILHLGKCKNSRVRRA
mmetsp:Transcript_48761/g.95327  ORF Transcript_48761/g.95327 Transcript_48761/m.95327 type:complete len:225 (-) Transcript_48761:652-1326(-)